MTLKLKFSVEQTVEIEYQISDEVIADVRLWAGLDASSAVPPALVQEYWESDIDGGIALYRDMLLEDRNARWELSDLGDAYIELDRIRETGGDVSEEA